MTITKAHLHRLFTRCEELDELLQRCMKTKDMEEWDNAFKELCNTAEGYGLGGLAWYYVRTFFDFVDDVNDGLAAEERFYMIEQTLRQIGVEITEEE